jgi:hypothetical protein
MEENGLKFRHRWRSPLHKFALPLSHLHPSLKTKYVGNAIQEKVYAPNYAIS